MWVFSCQNNHKCKSICLCTFNFFPPNVTYLRAIGAYQFWSGTIFISYLINIIANSFNKWFEISWDIEDELICGWKVNLAVKWLRHIEYWFVIKCQVVWQQNEILRNSFLVCLQLLNSHESDRAFGYSWVRKQHD